MIRCTLICKIYEIKFVIIIALLYKKSVANSGIGENNDWGEKKKKQRNGWKTWRIKLLRIINWVKKWYDSVCGGNFFFSYFPNIRGLYLYILKEPIALSTVIF